MQWVSPIGRRRKFWEVEGGGLGAGVGCSAALTPTDFILIQPLQ